MALRIEADGTIRCPKCLKATDDVKVVTVGNRYSVDQEGVIVGVELFTEKSVMNLTTTIEHLLCTCGRCEAEWVLPLANYLGVPKEVDAPPLVTCREG